MLPAQTAAAHLNKAALEHEAFSKSVVHRITGNLAASIQVEKSATPNSLEAVVVAGADYAAYEELGTRYRPGHPYFMPGFEAARSGFGGKI